MDNILITLTTTKNQKNIINNILTTIYLEECEDELRGHYNISINETLYMKKIDITQEKMRIPKIEYDIYSKLNGSNLIKLNISICKNNNIILSIPVNISENIDILNTSSDYYKDICYQSSSGSGTDMILNDRQKEFVEGNKTICQEECSLYHYDYDIKKVKCSCLVKESTNDYNDMNINKTKLYEKFGSKNDKDISNLKITSCNVFTSKENLKSNTGFYLLLIILFTFVVIFIIFCIKGYNSLKNKIEDIIYDKFKNETKIKKNIIDMNNNKIPSNKNTISKSKKIK